MPAITRRNFIGGAAAIAALSSTKASLATPLGLAPGIQLYSVRDQMAKDFEGTLDAVRKAGYLEVESAALPKKTAAEIRKALDQAGLKCVSSHRSFSDVTKNLDATPKFRQNPSHTRVWRPMN